MYIKLTVILTTLCILLTFGIFVSVSNAKIDPEKIIGIWLLDEGEGNTATDSSENGYDGNISNSGWVNGKVDDALEIKRGGTVTIPFGKAVMIDKVSFILWIQFTDIAAQQNYFSLWDQSNNRYVPYKEIPNTLRSWSNSWNVSSGLVVKAGTWYHVANTYDGNMVKIYVDGEEKVAQAVPKFQLQDQNQTAWLGTDQGAGFQSACIMDEVGLFNDALSKDEIQGIMENGIYHTAYAVEPSDKLSTVWGKLKQQ
ncbi:MAG: hypothetical protein OXD54_01815 [Candidatus Poribacteria bacterium]|nr:hypothetical protein [Candidatus Poribacteria bacterium]